MLFWCLWKLDVEQIINSSQEQISSKALVLGALQGLDVPLMSHAIIVMS